MSVAQSDFSNYSLEAIRQEPSGVFALADGVLPEIAAALEYELPEVPTTEAIQAFIGRFSPNKELQSNIPLVKDVISVDEAADLVEQSGVLKPVERGFAEPVELPERIDVGLITGGVANWMLRRRNLAERFNPEFVRSLVTLTGNREMKLSEHVLVGTFANNYGYFPTETDFAEAYMNVPLYNAGYLLDPIPTASSDGDEVIRNGIEIDSDLLDGKVLVFGNAPNTLQNAGQFRRVAREIYPSFDQDGDQLFMVGDTIQVARHGESAASHQNPYTALGQIARNALFLHQAANETASE